MIEAYAYTSARHMEAVAGRVDVTPWFEQATPDQIANLRKHKWHDSQRLGLVLPWMAEVQKEPTCIAVLDFAADKKTVWGMQVYEEPAVKWLQYRALANRAVAKLLSKHPVAEGEYDGMLPALGKVATDTPRLIAWRAYNSEVTAGYGLNPWHTVLLALGYPRDDRTISIASRISRLAYDVGVEAGEVGPDEEFNYSDAEEVWPQVEQQLRHETPVIPFEHIDAIKWVWFKIYGNR